MQELEFSNPPVTLNALAAGDPQRPCVILVHGLRDTAWALAPLAEALAQPGTAHGGYYAVILELRGHGGSSHSDGYAMANFLADLHCVVNTVAGNRCALFGHSLGGHLVTRYAALFPAAVAAVIAAEGLGPPRRPHVGDEAAELAAYREMLENRVLRHIKRNPGGKLSGIDEVCARLLKNNPRLHPQLAHDIAPHLVRKSADGGLQWAFDPRASSVFLGTSEADNARFWRALQAPTCLISGALSYEYWGRELGGSGFSGQFAEGEMEQRLAHFRHAEHHWFDKSGHMVHYDEPQRLAQLSRKFLEENYV